MAIKTKQIISEKQKSETFTFRCFFAWKNMIYYAEGRAGWRAIRSAGYDFWPVVKTQEADENHADRKIQRNKHLQRSGSG